MKGFLKRILPMTMLVFIKRVKNNYNLLSLFYNDYKRFRTTAAIHYQHSDAEHLRARITFHYHALEKGLSNPNIRLGFGQKALKGLLDALNAYDKLGYPKNDKRYQTGISVVQAYIDYHELQEYEVSNIKEQFAKHLQNGNKQFGGVISINLDKKINDRKKSFAELAKNRVSVRHYSNRQVDVDLIDEALEISMKTPSVCNRQPWEVYVIKNKDTQKKVLKNQKGFKGYEDTVDTLIIITADNKYLLSVNERNQGFIDGGMFAMSLLYSLEYVGLAACPLNGALPHSSDKLIRNEVGISDSENIIMFIAIGHFPDNYKVPRSQRDNHREITTYI